MDLARLHLQGGDAQDVAFGVADQVQRHPLHEEVGAGLHVLLVQRVQHGVTGSVGRGTGALHRLFAIVGGVAAKRALVDGAVWVAVKGHARVLEFVHHLGRLAAHELDGVLVTQPVRTLDGVEEVVMPVVFAHVAQRGTDTALRGHRVRAGGKHLGQHGHVQAGPGQAQRGLHAGAASTDDDDVEPAAGKVGKGHGTQSLQSTWTAQPAQPTSHTIENTCSAKRTPTGLT